MAANLFFYFEFAKLFMHNKNKNVTNSSENQIKFKYWNVLRLYIGNNMVVSIMPGVRRTN